MSSTRPTNDEIAADYRLWMTYVDTAGVDTEEQFNAMTMEQRLDIIGTCFPE